MPNADPLPDPARADHTDAHPTSSGSSGSSGSDADADDRAGPPEDDARFRALIELASDLILVLDAGGTVRYQSPSVSRAIGYPPDHLVGRSFFGFVQPADASRMLEAFERLARSAGATLDERIRLRHEDGSSRIFGIVARNLLDEPAVAGIVINARDLTDRAAAEQERARLAAILQATTDFVGIFDPYGHLIYINPAGRSLLGVSDEDDVTELGISDLHPPAAATRLIEQGITTAIRDGAWTGPSVLLDRTGNEVPVSQVVLAHRGSDGSLEFLSTIMRHASDRDDTEIDLRRGRTYFRSVVEAVSDVVAVLDPDGTVRYVNPTVRAVLGHEPDAIAGRDALDYIHPDDAGAIRDRLASGRLYGDVGPPHVIELRLRRSDGAWERLHATIHALVDHDDPAPRGLVLHLRAGTT